MLFFERDLELYISTVDSGFTTDNTVKLSALSGSSLSYKTKTQDIYNYKIDDSPDRLKEKILTGFSQPTFKFRTYAKPYNDTNIKAVEKLLLYSLTGNLGTESPSNYTITFTSSNKLPELYIYIKYDTLIYKLSNAVVRLAEYNIDIDKSLEISWDLVARGLENVSSTPNTYTDNTDKLGFVKNKFSKISLLLNSSSNTGIIPFISGNLKIINDVKIVDRNTLDQRANQLLNHYVMSRSIYLDFNTYLRTGNVSVAELFDTIQSDLSYNEGVGNNIETTLTLGSSIAEHLEFYMPNTLVELPEIKIQDVLSSNIRMSAKKLNSINDDIIIKYYA